MSAREKARDKDKERDTGSSGKWLRKLSRKMGGEAQDRGEVVEYLRDATVRGVIEGDALPMLEGVLEVSDIQVRDIMVPRAQMTFLNRDDESEVLLKTVIESGHSRFPVMDEDREKIVGVLLAKDLLRLAAVQPAGGEGLQFDIKEFMRPAVFVPESKRLNVLLREFRRSRVHMAIVADEYGGIAGLVTIEDVIEQIVGDIDDEHDVDEDVNIRRDGERQYVVRGQTPIDEFNEYFQTELSDDEFDTVAGLVMKQLGRLPRRGETLQLADCEVKVMRFDRRRIDTLRLTAPRDIVPPEDRPLVDE
ncbi:MAG TPA: transporter associated domain-containing protein [Steroidobacteraceae bacterium]|jgi:hemolysin (HlyC) family protein|nr:transporter associated domain-containing protein [Steroidobacteraceae bacterium]